MVTSHKDRAHESEKIVDAVTGKGGECTMCKFVLYFAFSTLFLVLVFTFFFRLQPPPVLEPLPPSLQSSAMSGEEVNIDESASQTPKSEEVSPLVVPE